MSWSNFARGCLADLHSGVHPSCGSQANCTTRRVLSQQDLSQELTRPHADAERAKFVVEKVRFACLVRSIPLLTHGNSQATQEKRAAIIRAEGEAEAAASISAALDKAGEAFVAFRKIEAAKAIVNSLSHSPNVTYVPSSDGKLLLNIPTDRT
jgi:regulator of protease activity HflC (stomatin/prohibitin superfamily)